MEDLINQLEQRINKLLNSRKMLEAENKKLRNNELSLLSEREVLIAKNKIAIGQIEKMVQRLKTLEKVS